MAPALYTIFRLSALLACLCTLPVQCDITAALELLCCVGSFVLYNVLCLELGKRRQRSTWRGTDFKEKLVWGREFSAKQEYF